VGISPERSTYSYQGVTNIEHAEASTVRRPKTGVRRSSGADGGYVFLRVRTRHAPDCCGNCAWSERFAPSDHPVRSRCDDKKD
jgi:hypothetical protein